MGVCPQGPTPLPGGGVTPVIVWITGHAPVGAIFSNPRKFIFWGGNVQKILFVQGGWTAGWHMSPECPAISPKVPLLHIPWGTHSGKSFPCVPAYAFPPRGGGSQLTGVTSVTQSKNILRITQDVDLGNIAPGVPPYTPPHGGGVRFFFTT